MRFFKGCLFSAFLVCLFSQAQAQVTPAALQGKILTVNGSPAAASTVVLLRSRDSSLVVSTVADTAGSFHFSSLQADSYLLLISSAGYQKLYAGPYRIKSGQPFTVPVITLKQLIQSLNQVNIVSSRPDIEAEPGKLVLNVQNSILAQGNSAFDILRQSPGVRVDNSNNISIIGKQNALITIDGKATNLTGEDLASVLRGIQSSTIDHIELITGGSAKYDASSGGIINIVLKKGKNIGFNAVLTGSAGYGRYYKSNAGFVFNDRTPSVNIFGNYSYTDNKNFHTINTNRQINFNDTVSNYNTNYNSVQKDRVHVFGIGTDFYLSSSQTIGIFVNGSVTNDNYVKNNSLAIYNQSVFDSTITATSNLNRHITRINYNLNYTGKLDTMGKTLSADVNYTTYDRSSAEYITNMFYDAAGNQYNNPLLLQNLSPSNIKVWISNVDFSDPISKTLLFEAGLKFSNAESSNDLVFGPFVNGQYTTDPNFTSHFDYNENINAGYVSFRDMINKVDIAASLRVEQTIATGNSGTAGQLVNSNYVDPFPTLSINYKADDKTNFSLSYSRGITRPGYEQINPFLYYIDLYDYSAGNPNLRPEYSNNVEFSYSYNKTFIATLYTNIISQNYEFKYFQQNDTTRVNVNIPTNLGTVYNYGIRFYESAELTRWWSAIFTLDAAYQRYVAYPQYGYLNKGTQDIIFASTQHFDISKTLTAEVEGKYESPTFYGISMYKAAYNVDAGISQQLFGKKASLKLSMADIFNNVRDRYSINYQNIDLAAVDKKESQIVRLTFTYRFGKTTNRAGSRKTGNEEENKRLDNSN